MSAPSGESPREARAGDVAALERCARAAYARYVPRIGREPAPMLADFADAIARGAVHVIEREGRVVGYVVAHAGARTTSLESVAVLPSHAGQGIGRALIAFVERDARDRGHDAVELYTNAKMIENLALYPRLGYVETGRRREHGFDRVFFAKALVPDEDDAAARARAEDDVSITLAEALARGASGPDAGASEDAHATLGELAACRVGARLFTLTAVDLASGVARRLHSSRPDVYPVSGTKPIERDAWSVQVLERHEPFVANDADALSRAFADHATIASLGCASVVNVPCVFGGRVLGTVNLLHEAGYYTPERVRRALTLAVPGVACLLLEESPVRDAPDVR